ncbi:response regulator [Tumebacillus sp. DT12]|uniref:Response regulator n=1 Tax=Tumebacillus lacus TaxID=2995335 RepID=A0ABT3WYJ5_9BACL|nr:response regulator [Tumebacillus lacus]MCX7569739.1 response regulator [Tumebacillus lacus]
MALKVLLLDGERLELMQTRRMLEDYSELKVVGAFQDPVEAVEQAAALQPDAVFLDVRLPGMPEILAAELLQERCPSAELVFVTADDRYALQAFELNALDYLLKPLHRSRLEKTVQRLLKRWMARGGTAHAPVRKGDVLCFQSIRFQRDGQAPEVPKWRTAKAQELFAYLLHRRGEVVRKGVLMEMLWPELDEKRAMKQLYATIYQVRQCLTKMKIDVTIRNSSIQEGYVLDAFNVRLDTEEWERAVKLAESGSEEMARLVRQYEGDYLQEHGYLWAEQERERLRRLWMEEARAVAQVYAQTDGMQAEAADLYERVQAVDPYEEEDGLTLLRLYEAAGRIDKVQECYHRLEHAFEQELGVEMPEAVVEWYEMWRNSRAMQTSL